MTPQQAIRSSNRSPKRAKTLQRHLAQWTTCQRCPLAVSRNRIVLGRGSVPSDLLFLGEAPGVNEDATGLPFIGRAGSVLKEALEEVFQGSRLTVFIANVLGCLPIDRHRPRIRTFRLPTNAELAACSPRVADLLSVVSPKAVVLLGKTAQKAWKLQASAFDHIPVYHLWHPSYVLRKGGKGSFEYAEFLLDLRKVRANVEKEKSCQAGKSESRRKQRRK